MMIAAIVSISVKPALGVGVIRVLLRR